MCSTWPRNSRRWPEMAVSGTPAACSSAATASSCGLGTRNSSSLPGPAPGRPAPPPPRPPRRRGCRRTARPARRGDPGGLLVGPRAADLGDQSEHPAETAAGVPRLQEFLDGGQGVAAVEEVGDLAQPRQMGVAVDIGRPRRSGRAAGRGPGRRGSYGPWRRWRAPGPRSGTRPVPPPAAPPAEVLTARTDPLPLRQGRAATAPAAARAAGEAARYSTAVRSEPSCEGWYDRRK